MTKLDPHAAQTLRELFISKAGQYPYLLPEAEILFANSAESKMHFTTRMPQEAANILQDCLNRDGNGIFDRTLPDGSISPLSFRMNKRVRIGSDQKEHVVMAFNVRYQSFEEDGHLWISDPETSKYFWLGDQKVDDKPPMTFMAPNIKDLITILNKAGQNWQDVNFLLPNSKPQFEVIENPLFSNGQA